MNEFNDDVEARLDTFGKFDSTVIDEANVVQQESDFNPFKIPTIEIEPPMDPPKKIHNIDSEPTKF